MTGPQWKDLKELLCLQGAPSAKSQTAKRPCLMSLPLPHQPEVAAAQVSFCMAQRSYSLWLILKVFKVTKDKSKNFF